MVDAGAGRDQRGGKSARKRAPLTNSDAAILSLVAAAAAALSLRLVDDDDKEKRGERGEREGETLYVVRGASRVAGEGRKEGRRRGRRRTAWPKTDGRNGS